jgi:hypothetical protein
LLVFYILRFHTKVICVSLSSVTFLCFLTEINLFETRKKSLLAAHEE